VLKRNVKDHWVLILLGGLALFAMVSALPMTTLRAEEPRRAIVAIEMLWSGNFVVPQIHGWPYYNKPPLFNWILASFFRVFGSTAEWVVRLPSLLAFFSTAYLTFRLAARYIDRQTGVVAGLFLLTFGDLLYYGTLTSGEIDLFFTLVTFLQVSMIFRGFETRRYTGMFVGSWLLAAVGVLTKGLPAIVFQVLTIGMMAVRSGNWRILVGWRHFLGIGLFLGLLAGYFLAYARQADPLPYLMNLIFEASDKSALETGGLKMAVNAISFPVNLAKALLPWSIFGVYLWSRSRRAALMTNPLLAFAFWFIVVNIPVYWLTDTFKSRYLYPFMPFMAIVLADLFQHRQPVSGTLDKFVQTVLATVVCLVPLVMLALPFLPGFPDFHSAGWKAIGLCLAGGAITWAYFKRADLRIYMVAGALLVARLGYNEFYLPVLQAKASNMAYREKVEKMVAFAGDVPVSLGGGFIPDTLEWKLGPVGSVRQVILRPPLVSFSIPYYYARTTGHLLTFETQLRPDRYYLLTDRLADSLGVSPVYRFPEPLLKKDLVLARK